MSLTRLALASLLLSASAWAERPRFTWPTPDAFEAAEVPGTLQAQGVPMKLKAVRVHHPPQQMVDLYFAAFERAGLYIPPEKDQVRLFADLTLTALDPKRNISYTVIFQDNRDGTTTLILGEANLALRGAPPADAAVPLFPGATGAVHAESEGARTVTYATPAAGKDVLAFYRDALTRAQFLPQSADAESAVYQTDAEELTVSARPDEKGQTRVVVVSRLRRGG
jgi:hypothetical protein